MKMSMKKNTAPIVAPNTMKAMVSPQFIRDHLEREEFDALTRPTLSSMAEETEDTTEESADKPRRREMAEFFNSEVNE